MLNHLCLQSRLVADPELRDTNGGTKVVNFRVAWSKKYKDKETKLFLECKSFGSVAEFIANHFKKGDSIVVEGELNTEEWDGQDGKKHSKIVLIVGPGESHFCGKKDSGSDVQPSMTPVELASGDLPF